MKETRGQADAAVVQQLLGGAARRPETPRDQLALWVAGIVLLGAGYWRSRRALRRG